MLQKILAFILLVSHVNFSMFIAQVDEVDNYDKNGRRINDINSLTEYINDVLLNHHDKPREDEDDDNARYFHFVKLNTDCFNPYGTKVEGKVDCTKDKNKFPDFITRKLLSVFFDVITPPPKTIV